MHLRKMIDEDKSGTVKNMLLLIALWAVTGACIGAMAVLVMGAGGCGGTTEQVVRDVTPKVVELTAEECVKIATIKNRPDLAELCATAEDIAPFLDLIMAQQKARLAREAASASPPAAQPPPAPQSPPAASSAPAPASASASSPPAPGGVDPCAGRK